MTQFVIGIGSQRAGSTLLHKIIDECTDIFMHPVKELHYYDTLFGVRKPEVLTEFSLRQLNREIDRLVDAKAYGYIDKRYKCFIRANRILANSPVDKIDYIDLFRPCIMGNKMLGEITPEYMVLPDEGVKKMANDLGSDTKIILISRDPVDRFVSAFKLLKVYNNPNYDMDNFGADIEAVIEQMPSWIQQQDQLNDYKSALERYEKYFDNILFLSYEDIITKPGVIKGKLECFLHTSINKEKLKGILGKKVNAIGETGDVPDTVISMLERRYEGYIDYLSDRVGS